MTITYQIWLIEHFWRTFTSLLYVFIYMYECCTLLYIFHLYKQHKIHNKILVRVIQVYIVYMHMLDCTYTLWNLFKCICFVFCVRNNTYPNTTVVYTWMESIYNAYIYILYIYITIYTYTFYHHIKHHSLISKCVLLVLCKR